MDLKCFIVLELIYPPLDFDWRILHADPLHRFFLVEDILSLRTLLLSVPRPDDGGPNKPSDTSYEVHNSRASEVVESLALRALISKPAAAPGPPDNNRIDEAGHDR